MSETETITLADATALIEAAFRATGLPQAAAHSVAAALVAAEAEGQVGHGFSRLADYAAQARSGKVNAAAVPEARMAHTTSVLVDAHHGFAYPALDLAVETGTRLAREYGTSAMMITRSHHCGALSVQVDRIARAGLIGFMCANTPAAMAPWGGKTPVFGTNPIAFAVPRADAAPLVIDLSLSKVARGKIMNAKKQGKSEIPEGWALDSAGNPTTDPDAALAGSMVPAGDAKGTALALMVEILSAVVTGANTSSEATSFFAAEGDPPGVGQFLMAIAPPGGVDFGARLEGLLAQIDGQTGARLPGERRLAALAAAKRDGLAVPRHYIDAARALAAGGSSS